MSTKLTSTEEEQHSDITDEFDEVWQLNGV